MSDNGDLQSVLSSHGFVFASGVRPTVCESGDAAGASVRVQLEQAFDNLKHLLVSSHSDLSHVVSIQVIIPDRESAAIVDQTCRRKLMWNKAARSIIVGGLSNASVLVEINAVAVLSPDRIEESLSEQLAQALAQDAENAEESIVFKTAA